MNLGLSQKGNNWKLILGNFIIMFVVQMILSFNDIFNGAEDQWPSVWTIVKITFNSLAATLIFYGLNKKLDQRETA